MHPASLSPRAFLAVLAHEAASFFLEAAKRSFASQVLAVHEDGSAAQVTSAGAVPVHLAPLHAYLSLDSLAPQAGTGQLATVNEAATHRELDGGCGGGADAFGFSVGCHGVGDRALDICGGSGLLSGGDGVVDGTLGARLACDQRGRDYLCASGGAQFLSLALGFGCSGVSARAFDGTAWECFSVEVFVFKGGLDTRGIVHDGGRSGGHCFEGSVRARGSGISLLGGLDSVRVARIERECFVGTVGGEGRGYNEEQHGCFVL